MSAERVANTIVTFCKKCGAQLRAPAALAGKGGKCAQCGAAIQIPLKSEPVPASASQKPDEKVKPDEKQRKSTNMVLVSLVAAIVGVALGLGIYALFLMGPSGSVLPPPAMPKVLESDPDAAPPEPTATSPGGEPSVPTVINLVPKGQTPTRRTPLAPTSNPPRPSPPTDMRPGPRSGPGPGSGFSPGSGPRSGPGSSPRSGPGPGPGSGGRMGGRPSSVRSVDVWDAIHQGLVSITLTVQPNKVVEITAKREIQVPFVVVIKKGVRPFAASQAGQISVQASSDVFIDLSSQSEASIALPQAGEATVKTLTIAAEKKPPGQP
jgi:hypothetical protein